MKVLGNENSPRRSLLLARDDLYVREQLREGFRARKAGLELDDDSSPCGSSRGNIDSSGLSGTLFVAINDLKPRFELLDVRMECSLEVPFQSDFFRTLPSGGDAYILKCVIHDWDDWQANAMLTDAAER